MAVENSPQLLSDEDLVSALQSLVSKENLTTIAVLDYLNEVERRELFVLWGYDSMWSFCVKRLKYAEPAVARRLRSARCMVRYPAVRDLLLQREMSLTTVSMISSHLCAENCEQLLREVSGKSKAEVERVLAKYKPEKVVQDRIMPIACSKGTEKPVSSSSGNCQSIGLFGSEAAVRNGNACGDASSKKDLPESEPRFEVRFSASAGFMTKLERIREELSRKHPRGVSLEAVFSAAMDELLAKSSKKPLKRTRNQRKTGFKKSRYISKAIKHEVFKRDGGSCTFTGKDGVCCGSRWNLQYDHIVPFALGGSNTADNLTLRCQRHNLFGAKQVFGKEYVESFSERRKITTSG